MDKPLSSLLKFAFVVWVANALLKVVLLGFDPRSVHDSHPSLPPDTALAVSAAILAVLAVVCLIVVTSAQNRQRRALEAAILRAGR